MPDSVKVISEFRRLAEAAPTRLVAELVAKGANEATLWNWLGDSPPSEPNRSVTLDVVRAYVESKVESANGVQSAVSATVRAGQHRATEMIAEFAAQLLEAAARDARALKSVASSRPGAHHVVDAEHAVERRGGKKPATRRAQKRKGDR